jgi:hypothetical protein
MDQYRAHAKQGFGHTEQKKNVVPGRQTYLGISSHSMV